MIIEADIRHEVKRCLDKINAKRSARLHMTNDQRAAAMGFYFDAKGVLRTKSRSSQTFSKAALITSWPIINAKG